MSAAPTLAIDVATESAQWDKAAPLDGLIERALHEALAASKVRLRDGAEVSVLLCDDEFSAELNKKWRDRDQPTNVLSFPAGGDLAGAPMLGDIVVAYETTAREAAAENKSFEDHVGHLLVHGFLHLLGYDHETEAEAETMENLEREVLALLGIADPYRGTRVESAQTR
jgi:probable rRNA maturation factor